MRQEPDKSADGTSADGTSADGTSADGTSADGGSADLILTAPLFPLPNVVLFPRVVLPLHIFEERYKALMEHALAGQRTIAMALLRPGWEKNYHCRPAIEQVVCVGKILSWEKLADGKYNLLLQGHQRGQIAEEVPSSPFRIAKITPIQETRVLEIDLLDQRQKLLDIFAGGPLATTMAGKQIKQILSSPLSTSDAADLIAFNFLDDTSLKQSLLSDGDVMRRISRLLHALQTALPVLEAACQRDEHDYRSN